MNINFENYKKYLKHQIILDNFDEKYYFIGIAQDKLREDCIYFILINDNLDLLFYSSNNYISFSDNKKCLFKDEIIIKCLYNYVDRYSNDLFFNGLSTFAREIGPNIILYTITNN